MDDMYYRHKSDPQNSAWVTVRGTSKLEGYHPHLARALPGTGYAPDIASPLPVHISIASPLQSIDGFSNYPSYTLSAPEVTFKNASTYTKVVEASHI